VHFLGESVINERHPLFAGIYSGVSSNGFTKDLVENSDCLLMFGVMLTDMNLCFMPAKFKKRQVVSASVGGLTVKNHAYMDVQFADFCEAIFKCEFEKREAPVLPMREKKPFEPKENTKITSARFFQQIDAILNKNMAIVADIGDTLFGAGDLTVHHNNHFLSPAFYTSMGFAIPGALGVQTAKPDVRPIVLVGDGAFQMTVAEISTLVERKLNPIIFILNNQGYTTERFLRDGGFNDIRNWNYHMVSDLFNGGCEGVQVKTEEDLHSSVLKALDSKCPFLLNVMIDKNDISPGLKRMTEALAKRV
jgi:indolepyruvate decarboxylase